MINKRGLSPEEYYSLDDEVLNMLMIYDAYIEPSGAQIEMLRHAYSCYFSTINNPNLSSEARKSIKVKDFDFLDLLDNDSTMEKNKKREDARKAKQKNDMKAFGDALKKQVLGKNKNGK